MSDLISRQAAIDALRNQMSDWNDDYNVPVRKSIENIERLPSAEPTTCEYWDDESDFCALQRPSAQTDMPEKTVWFRIGETLVDVSKSHITAEEGIVKIRGYLQRMQKPERKKGKWIFKPVFPDDKSEFPQGYLECSVCGSHHKNSTPCNYCDNCGADMREEVLDEQTGRD